jgi:hypothetical protein
MKKLKRKKKCMNGKKNARNDAANGRTITNGGEEVVK